MKGLKIALVVVDLKMGGKEQSIVDLANALFEKGHRPVIICLDTARRAQGRCLHNMVPVFEMKKGPGNSIGLPFRLAKLLKRERVQIVHSNNWGTLLECVVAARLAGIRSVVHAQHGLDYEYGPSRSRSQNRFRIIAKRLASRWISRIVAVSEEVRDMVKTEWDVPDDKVMVIHNGVPLNGMSMGIGEICSRRRKLFLDETNFVIGSVGMFRPVKDFTALIEALAQVVGHVPQARLVLIGEGPCRTEIEESIRRLDLGAYVRLLGLRSDVSELLPLMDLFALPSISEGISISVLEAMGAGLPVVATRVGGNPEIINDMETGILIPPRSPFEMAEAILSLSGDRNKRLAIAQRARKHVSEKFSIKQMVQNYQEMYQSILRT